MRSLALGTSRMIALPDLWLTSAEQSGGAVIAPRHVTVPLKRYCTNLMVKTDHPTYKVMLRGSATCLRYRDRFFLICTRHQLAGENNEDVRLLRPWANKLIRPSSGKMYTSQSSDSDKYDIIAFDFTEACVQLPDLASNFFNFDAPAPDAKLDGVAGYTVLGFPSKDQGYFPDEVTLILRERIQNAILMPAPTEEALLLVRMLHPLQVGADGMSGGAVFHTHVAGSVFVNRFAGMTVRGGNDYIYFLRSSEIQAFLDAALVNWS